MYKIQLNNITDTTNSVYKEVDRSHLKDIEAYFKSMKPTDLTVSLIVKNTICQISV